MPNSPQQQAARATRHGYYAKTKRATTEHCASMCRRWHNDGFEWCEEWQDADFFSFVDFVIDVMGHRQPQLMLSLKDESLPIGPDNLEWVPRRLDPPSRKMRFWMARHYDEYQHCLCDDRGQELCWSSGRPCGWLVRKRMTELWADE